MMPARQETLTLRNDLAELSPLAAFIDTFLDPLQPDSQDVMAFQLSLEEIVTNVINHGYRDGAAHTFSVTLSTDGTNVTAVIADDAPAFDPLARGPVDINAPLEEREIGGLGIHLVKKLMHDIRYERRDGRNVLTITRALRRAT